MQTTDFMETNKPTDQKGSAPSPAAQTPWAATMRTPEDVLLYWRNKLTEERASEESCRRHAMPDQAKWHEGKADSIDHFLLDLEFCILRQKSPND